MASPADLPTRASESFTSFPFFYDDLGVTTDATPAELRAAYLKVAMACHPDRNPENREAATAQFQRIGQAYEVLGDPALRSRYDHKFALHDEQLREAARAEQTGQEYVREECCEDFLFAPANRIFNSVSGGAGPDPMAAPTGVFPAMSEDPCERVFGPLSSQRSRTLRRSQSEQSESPRINLRCAARAPAPAGDPRRPMGLSTCARRSGPPSSRDAAGASPAPSSEATGASSEASETCTPAVAHRYMFGHELRMFGVKAAQAGTVAAQDFAYLDKKQRQGSHGPIPSVSCGEPVDAVDSVLQQKVRAREADKESLERQQSSERLKPTMPTYAAPPLVPPRENAGGASRSGGGASSSGAHARCGGKRACPWRSHPSSSGTGSGAAASSGPGPQPCKKPCPVKVVSDFVSNFFEKAKGNRAPEDVIQRGLSFAIGGVCPCGASARKDCRCAAMFNGSGGFPPPAPSAAPAAGPAPASAPASAPAPAPGALGPPGTSATCTLSSVKCFGCGRLLLECICSKQFMRRLSSPGYRMGGSAPSAVAPAVAATDVRGGTGYKVVICDVCGATNAAACACGNGGGDRKLSPAEQEEAEHTGIGEPLCRLQSVSAARMDDGGSRRRSSSGFLNNLWSRLKINDGPVPDAMPPLDERTEMLTEDSRHLESDNEECLDMDVVIMDEEEAPGPAVRSNSGQG